jgi:hypothetical protein
VGKQCLSKIGGMNVVTVRFESALQSRLEHGRKRNPGNPQFIAKHLDT